MKFPAGKYAARAVPDSGRLGKSNQKGTDYVSVECEILQPEGFGGQTITWTGWLTEKAGDRTIDTLRLMGWDGDSFENLTGFGSAQFELAIEGEEYNGNTDSKIKFVNPLPTAMDADYVKSLAMKFHDKIKNTKPTKSGPPAAAKGDDIPF